MTMIQKTEHNCKPTYLDSCNYGFPVPQRSWSKRMQADRELSVGQGWHGSQTVQGQRNHVSRSVALDAIESQNKTRQRHPATVSCPVDQIATELLNVSSRIERQPNRSVAKRDTIFRAKFAQCSFRQTFGNRVVSIWWDWTRLIMP